MKKKIILFLLLIVAIASLNVYSDTKKEVVSLVLDNTEALAQGEVVVPGLCAVISNDICMLFDDGYFLIGTRVA